MGNLCAFVALIKTRILSQKRRYLPLRRQLFKEYVSINCYMSEYYLDNSNFLSIKSAVNKARRVITMKIHSKIV